MSSFNTFLSDAKAQDSTRGGASPQAGGSAAEVQEFIGAVKGVEATLSVLQKRHLQAEYLFTYEQERRTKAESMGAEVVDHGRRFAGRVDEGLNQLQALTAYLKSRGAAERAYAAALSKSAEVLAMGTAGGTSGAQLEALAKGHGDAKGLFLQVDLELMAPKVSAIADSLEESLPQDVGKVLTDYQTFRSRTRPALALLHKDFLKNERLVRDAHASMMRAFNGVLDSLRASAVATKAASSSMATKAVSNPASAAAAVKEDVLGFLDPTQDPWIAEQAYRSALSVSNRHAELYLSDLASLDDQLILLGQKQAVVVMCAQKILVYEQWRLHADAAIALEALHKSVQGDHELLAGKKTVDVALSDVRKGAGAVDDGPCKAHEEEEEEEEGGVDGSGGVENGRPINSAEKKKKATEDDLPYPFQMALPPSGTNAYEDDLYFVQRDAPAAGNQSPPAGLVGAMPMSADDVETQRRAVEALVAEQGGGGWKRVRAVLTNDRVLHLFDHEAAKGSTGNAGSTPSLAPLKSINCRADSSKGFEVNSAVGTCRVVSSVGGKGGSARRQSFAVGAADGPPNLTDGDDDDDDDEEEEEEEEGGGGEAPSSRQPSPRHEESAAMRTFEVATKSNSLLRAFNPFASRGPAGEKHDYFVFVANNRRGLEVWLALLRNHMVDLGDPLAVAACAEDSIARRKATANLFRGDNFGDISDEDEEDYEEEEEEEAGGSSSSSSSSEIGGVEDSAVKGSAIESAAAAGTESEEQLEELMAGLGGFGDMENSRDSVFESSQDISAEDALFGMMNEHA